MLQATGVNKGRAEREEQRGKVGSREREPAIWILYSLLFEIKRNRLFGFYTHSLLTAWLLTAT